MLHFVTGKPGSGKSTYLLQQLQAILQDETTPDRSILFLVPEQQTVLWETRLATTFPLSSQRKWEVTNFTRLANTVFRQYGGLSKPLIDEGGRTLVLWRAMLSVWDILTVYNHGADGREDRNLPMLASAIGELKQSRISPALVEQAATTLSSDPEDATAGFVGRLGDISLLYAAYEEMLHTEYADRDDLMTSLVQTLTTHPFFVGKSVFVDSFYSLTPPELRILRCAMTDAKDVWVTFACERTNDDALPFFRIRTFRTQMERLAADLSCTPHWVTLTEDKRHTTPGLTAIATHLFQSSPTENTAPHEHTNDAVSEDTVPDVSVYACADRYEEAEAVAALIEEKVRGGCRYRDIAVVSRRMDALRGILDTTLTRHGIPCFLAEADPLSTAPIVRLFTSLLAVQSRGFDRRDLIRMIATGLTPVTAEDGDCFAMYTETWNIRGRTMFCGDGTAPDSYTWSWNPDGYKAEISPWGKLCLASANRARDLLLPPVAEFCDLFVSQTGEDGKKTTPVATVEDICRGLVVFAERLGLYPRLMALSAQQVRAGQREEGAKTAQIWDKLCAALDKLVSLLGDISLDAGRFSGLFTKVISSMDIGAIPTAMDEVLIGSADGIRFGEVQHVILVGAVEGEFPADVTDSGFFRDSDRVLLEGVGITLSGSSEAYLAEEYWMFYRTAVTATKTLTILCPRRSAGEALSPSPGVTEILELLHLSMVDWRSLPLDQRVFHPSARVEDAAVTAWLLEKLPEPATRPYYPGLLHADHDRSDPVCVGAILGSRMHLTQSRLDKFAECPFRYWCQYGMALQEAPHASITAPDIGNFIHAILEQFFRETADREYPLSDEETNAIAERLIRDYLERLGVLETGRLGYLFGRLRRSVSVFLAAIMEEYAQGRFVPMGFEVPVGQRTENEDVPYIRPVQIETEGGVTVTLSGVIDRIDRYTAEDGREYVRVVDYKTGTRSFSLAEVRQGMHVQLLLYLFSLWQGGIQTKAKATHTVLPAGAVYFQVRPGEVASESMLTPDEARALSISHVGRSGIWLRDEEILEAMDNGLTGKYVPITRKKDGTLTGKATLHDLAQFGALYEELRSLIGKMALEIHEGRSNAAPRITPGKNACTYCPYHSICRIP